MTILDAGSAELWIQKRRKGLFLVSPFKGAKS
jgi:hypothetical protein